MPPSLLQMPFGASWTKPLELPFLANLKLDPRTTVPVLLMYPILHSPRLSTSIRTMDLFQSTHLLVWMFRAMPLKHSHTLSVKFVIHLLLPFQTVHCSLETLSRRQPPS